MINIKIDTIRRNYKTISGTVLSRSEFLDKLLHEMIEKVVPQENIYGLNIFEQREDGRGLISYKGNDYLIVIGIKSTTNLIQGALNQWSEKPYTPSKYDNFRKKE